jgi:hypothetical protein
VKIGEVLAAEQDVRGATDYVLGRIAGKCPGPRREASRGHGRDRRALYDGRETSERWPEPHRGRGRLPATPYPSSTFIRSLRPTGGRTGRLFQFESDYHWNEHGQAVVARAIAGAMTPALVSRVRWPPSRLLPSRPFRRQRPARPL